MFGYQPAVRDQLRKYAVRIHTEESFGDDKSGGFDVVHTRLQHADRLERLLPALAIATLWRHELGEHFWPKAKQRAPLSTLVPPAN